MPQIKKSYPSKNFDGEMALENIRFQVSLGPRIPGSDAHRQLVSWLQAKLRDYGWEVEIQNGIMMDHPIQNVIARRGTGKRWIILIGILKMTQSIKYQRKVFKKLVIPFFRG